MFAGRYFAPRYYPNRYFPQVGAEIVSETCTVSGNMVDISDTAVEGAQVNAVIYIPIETGSTISVFMKKVKTTTDASGDWSLALRKNATVSMEFIIPDGEEGSLRFTSSFTVPDQLTAEYNDLI